jgi:hypothetical protein
MTQLRTSIQAAFTPHFCNELEYHLSTAFYNFSDKKYRWMWCDGIDEPDMAQQPSKNPRYVITMAWFGETGQDRYKMTIKLGKRSLVSCREGLGLSNCLPEVGSLDWVTLDVENKDIVLRLK